jgi:uncharacterized protein (TIGR01777 family)
VTGIGTSDSHPIVDEYDSFNWISADTTRTGPWQKGLATAGAIVKLTGRTIFQLWTEAVRQSIYDSRIMTTQHIVAAMEPGTQLINASAVGYYGDSGDRTLTEDCEPGDDFLAAVCKDWEAEALNACSKEISVSILRFGVVLGNGGALSKMLPAFRMGVGGPLGSGRHWFPWVHILDLTQAVINLLKRDMEPGIYNLTAPGVIRHKEFATALGQAMHRPSLMPAPAFMIRLIMGALGASLLNSQKALPKGLEEQGFEFKFPTIESALSDLVGGI